MTDAHDAFDLIEERFSAALDETLDPAGPDGLYDYVPDLGLPAGAAALDVGCGAGEHAVRLARRFGLQVTGIDPAVGARLARITRLSWAKRPVTARSGSADTTWMPRSCRWNDVEVASMLLTPRSG